MTTNLGAARIKPELGVRLQELFNLDGKPRTLRELVKLVSHQWIDRIRDPKLNAHLRAICNGTDIFGNVGYKTRHLIKVDKRQFYSACALDAIIEGMFAQIEIESSCFHCDLPIRMRMSKGKIISSEPSPKIVTWLGASHASQEGDAPRCSCETDCCPHINFFAPRQHVTDWKTKNRHELGMPLTLTQSLLLAKEGWWEPISKVQRGNLRPKDYYRVSESSLPIVS